MKEEKKQTRCVYVDGRIKPNTVNKLTVVEFIAEYETFIHNLPMSILLYFTNRN